MKCKWILIFLMAAGTNSEAGGFRCGTRLVITGDPVSRLLKSCGEPAYRYKSRVSLEEHGRAVQFELRLVHGSCGRRQLRWL